MYTEAWLRFWHTVGIEQIDSFSCLGHNLTGKPRDPESSPGQFLEHSYLFSLLGKLRRAVTGTETCHSWPRLSFSLSPVWGEKVSGGWEVSRVCTERCVDLKEERDKVGWRVTARASTWVIRAYWLYCLHLCWTRQGNQARMYCKESTYCFLRYERVSFNPWARKIPWSRKLATQFSILAWEIPWTEEPDRL